MRTYNDSMVGFLSGNATIFWSRLVLQDLFHTIQKSPVSEDIFPDISGEELSAANILSPTELLAAFTTVSADAPRQAINLCRLI